MAVCRGAGGHRPRPHAGRPPALGDALRRRVARLARVLPRSRPDAARRARRRALARRRARGGRRPRPGSVRGRRVPRLDLPVAARRPRQPGADRGLGGGATVRARPLPRRVPVGRVGAQRTVRPPSPGGEGAGGGDPDRGRARPPDRLPGRAGRQARGRRALRAHPFRFPHRSHRPPRHADPGARRRAGQGRRERDRSAALMRRRGLGPRRRRWQELRTQRRRGIFLLPSLLTTGNLFCGFLALILSVQLRYDQAALAIFVAIVMDMLDGRIARLMGATSQFGVEFDSLADVVSFCVAPAFLLYSFALKDLSRPAWFGAFLFVICGALRLARFNVQTGSVDRRFFIGLSTPAAAGAVASSVLLLGSREVTRGLEVAVAVGSYIVALLMVSTFRYWSFKEIDFARRRPVRTLLVVVLAIMIVATHHELFLFVLFTGYAMSGPLRRLIIGRAAVPGPAEARPGDIH